MRPVEANLDTSGMEWELSKENVQPLKGGRNVGVLNDALKGKVEGPAHSSVLEQQHRQFLQAIENYVGEDPLIPWIRYIKWVNDAYPAGGAQSELLKVLERCTRLFQKDERYSRDLRYLRIWVQYADCCSDPSDVFAFLEANDIGQEYALFYEAYATSMEVRRKFSKADEIYNLGLQRSAQPLARLESMYRSFLNRMHRRGERKLREEQQAIADHNENDMQFRSFGPPAVYSGDAVGQQARRHVTRPGAIAPPRKQASRQGNAGISVFVDPEFGGPPAVSDQEAISKGSQAASWCHIGSVADKRKENVQQPAKWIQAKIVQGAHGQHGPRSDLKIFVDEEFAEECNPKPQINVTKTAAPSLRLRLEDMQKIRRHSQDLKGSFLDLPESFPASTNQGSTPGVSDSSRNVSVHDGTFIKSHAKDVFGYDSSLLHENGTDRSFDEVRFLVWSEKQVTQYIENSPITVSDPRKYGDSHRLPQPSFTPDTDNRFKVSRNSTELETVVAGHVGNESNVSLQSSSSQRNVDRGDDAFNERPSPLLKRSNPQGVTNHMMNSDGEGIVGCLSREPPAAKEKHLTDCQLQPTGTTLPSIRPDQPPVVLLNSFSMQGDETVAIKRFAEEAIVLGSDPKVNSIDAVSHHGLVEPTINTKEALADILDMFSQPLQSDNAPSKVRKPKDTKKRVSNPITKSSGFKIFVDEDLGTKSPTKSKQSEKRTKAVSGRSSANPVVQTRGFDSYADENSSVQRPRGSINDDRVINRPLDSISPFNDIYEDEAVDFQGPSNLSRSREKHGVTSSNSSVDRVFQSRGFDSSMNENFQRECKAPAYTGLDPALGSSTFQISTADDVVKDHLQLAKNDDYCSYQILADDNFATKRSVQPVKDDGLSAFQVFVDDDFAVERPLQPGRNDGPSTILADDDLVMNRPLQAANAQSRVEASFRQSIGVDDELRELALSSKLDADNTENERQDHEDKDLGLQVPSNLSRSMGKYAVASSNSSVASVSRPGGFDTFVDEDSQRESKAAKCTAFNPALGSSTFEILADEDLVTERQLQAAKAGSTTESAFCQSTGVYDGLQELALSSNKLDADNTKNQPRDHLSLLADKLAAKNVFGSDDCGVHGASEEPYSEGLAVASQKILKELNFGRQSSASPQRSTSPEKYEFEASSPNAHRKQEGGENVNVATRRMTVNPWDERNVEDLLSWLKPHIRKYEDFFENHEKYDGSVPISSLRSSNLRNKVLQLGSSSYLLKRSVGQGAYGTVFEVDDEDDDLFENAAKLALKFQKPACLWEFYMYRQLDMRVGAGDRCYYGQVHRFHLYSDSSFLICNFGDKGTLQDVVNAYLAKDQRMDETLCVFYTIELLRILEVLHGVGIIHGDFKPDNLLIRDDSDELEVWTPGRSGCWSSQGLSLIDWGRSIDLTLYPEGVQFMGDCKTDSFRCPEMLERRPWRFQVDTFGLCGTVHCLLHGSYMQIDKTRRVDGQITYRPRSPYRRYWNVELWREFFETLLNVHDSGHNPPLRELRENFENHLVGNSLGKKVRDLLKKQNVMMFSSL